MPYTSLLNPSNHRIVDNTEASKKKKRNQLRIRIGTVTNRVKGKTYSAEQVSFYIGRDLLRELGVKDPTVEPNRVDVLFDAGDRTGIIRLRKDGMKVHVPSLRPDKQDWTAGVVRLRGLGWRDTSSSGCGKLMVLEAVLSPAGCGGVEQCELLFELPKEISIGNVGKPLIEVLSGGDCKPLIEVLSSGDWRD